MTLTGKGYYIWKIKDCEGGDAAAIRTAARQAGLSHVLIKVADGNRTYNYDSATMRDLVAPVAQQLRAEGIQVWGWQYIYGDDPISEARKAIQRVRELNLDGFVVNAEVEFKSAGKDVAARKYMLELRNALGSVPIALSTYRFPSYHPQFPYDEFLEFCDLNMPQVYWQGAHNPQSQLQRTQTEYAKRKYKRPMIPTGSAYSFGNWSPTENDVRVFLQSVRAMNLSAANFWSWDFARNKRPNIWNAIANFPWETGGGPVPPPPPPPAGLPEQMIDAMNKKDPVRLAVLYTATGLRMSNGNMVQRPEQLLVWYHNFLNQTFPDGEYTLTGISGTGNSRHFTWEGTSRSTGKRINNGNDTIGIKDGRIAYHYSFFNIT